jgi:rare lipoprotein A
MRQRILLLFGVLVFLPLLFGAAPPIEEVGTASWYGGVHQGRLTASGEPFDEHRLTAAHRTLPMGTRVVVTNLGNGRSVVVRITDRGPGIQGRIIDLSRAAAERLGFCRRGLTRVKISAIRKGQQFSEAHEEREPNARSSVDKAPMQLGLLTQLFEILVGRS